MKTTIALCVLATAVESFTVMPPATSTTRLAASNEEDYLEYAREEWKKEAKIAHAVEHSLEDDPDLKGMVQPPHEPKSKYIDQEEHKHDSLFDEIEHAVFSDPDLANVLDEQGRRKKAVNQGFMEKEAHVHDSLLNEIEHSLDTDSYL